MPVFVILPSCASLRSASGDPILKINRDPVRFVIDHRAVADVAGCAGALQQNMEPGVLAQHERHDSKGRWNRLKRTPERICQQLNIEQFAHVAMTAEGARRDGGVLISQVPTAHTPTANGIGVLGWGVGGIEAEAAALGQPITTLVPKVGA